MTPRDKNKKNTKKTKAKPQAKAASAPKQKRSLLGRFCYFGAIAGVWTFIAGVIALFFLALDLPNLDNPPAPGQADRAVIVKAENGATLVRTGPIYGDWLSFNEIPDTLIQAFLAIEDRYFFSHIGFDVRGLGRAVVTNVKAGRFRAGGSTITQQLAKNLFLSNTRTMKRKAQELLLTLWLEQKFTKKQIVTLYLNRVYFGGGAYGVDAASRKFFGHSATELSIAESAMLAGLVQSPSRLAPHINPDGAWTRAQIVLGAMVDTGSLSKQAAGKISTQPPRLAVAVAGRDVRYYTDWVTSEAMRLIPSARHKSIIIYSTLDPGIQRASALALERGLSGEGKQRGASQGAIVAIDHDGAVRAMVGGADYGKSQFNRAVQALRQPGSAFKLFSYLAALEAGIRPTEKYIDYAVTVDDWSPQNYDKRFHGEMSVAEAFARSINTIAVQVSEKVGRERVAAMAKRLGLSTYVQPLASLPLGTEEVRLIDLAAAYAAIANGGHLAKAYSVVEITTVDGEVLYRKRPEPPKPVLAYTVVKDMTNMLTGVIKNGSGRNAAIDRPAAGKTGTSQDNRDAVFVGFTSDITAAVWVGNDDGTPMKTVTGGGLPARIWHDFMLDAHAGKPIQPLLVDAGIYGSAAKETGNIFTPGDTPAEEETKKKKRRSLLDRLFGN